MIDDYSSVIDDAAKEYGIDPKLLKAHLTVESHGNPNAFNDEYGAAGMAQLIPKTAKSLGVNDPYDPKQAIEGAAKLIAENTKRYPDQEEAIMAYHGGTDKKSWGPKTKDYKDKVMAQMQDEYDPFSDSSIAAKPEEIDPFDQESEPESPKITTGQLAMKEAKNLTEPLFTADRIKSRLADVGEFTDWVGSQMSAPEGSSPLRQAIEPPLKMAAIIPSMGIGEAVGALGGIATKASPELAQFVGESRLAQIAAKAGSGYIQGAGSNALMGQDVNQGGEIGAVLNTAIPGIGKLASSTTNYLTGKVAPEIAQLAKTAADKYKISIPGGLISDSPLINRGYSMLERLGMNPQNDNVEKFARAASKEFGEDTPKLTREVMENAGDKIGQKFEDVGKNVPEIKISDTTLDKLAQLDEIATSKTGNENNYVSKEIKKLFDIASKNDGNIPHDSWKSLINSKSTLSETAKDWSHPLGKEASKLKTTLFDALGESSGADKNAYKEAQKQWKSYKTVEKAAPDPITGELSPTKLAGAVKRQITKYGSRGLENLQELGDIGQQFKLTPSSGTAENYLLAKGAGVIGKGALGSGLGYGAYAGGASLPAAAATVGGTYLAGKAAGKALSSEWYRNKLVNDTLNPTPGILNRMMSSPVGEFVGDNYISAGSVGINSLSQ